MAKTIAEEYNPIVYLDSGICLYDIIESKVKKSGKSRFNWIERDNKQFTQHVYDTRICKGEVEIREIIRTHEDGTCEYKDCYYLDYGCGAGLHTIWENKSTYDGRYEIFENWEHSDKMLSFLTKDHTYARDLQCPEEIIVLDNSLLYCAYNGEVDFIEFLKLYRKYPIAEMVMKLKLYRFLNEKALIELTDNKAFRSYVYLHRDEIGNLSFTWTKNAFKRNVRVNDYASSLTDRIQCGKLAKECLRDQYDFVKKYASQERIAKYIQDNDINRGSYADYVEAARWLQLDFNDTRVLFPKNFKEVHDSYTNQYSDYKAEQESIKEKGISSAMGIVAKKYKFIEMALDGYVFTTAKNKLDLIKEGKALNHCVGRMDYDKRQAEEKSIICFLRNAKTPKMPFITIELNCSDLKVLQCYAEHDSRPAPEIMDIVDLWNKKIIKIKKRSY